jgi:hypothetical protein
MTVADGVAVLPHAVADDLAAAEGHFVAVAGVVLLDLQEEIGVRQAHGVALRRSVQVGVLTPGHLEAHGVPLSEPSSTGLLG